MAPLTGLVACAIYLLSVAHNAGSIQVLPECKGNKAIAENVRRLLAVEVIVAKRQLPEPGYKCDLEFRAHQYVNTNPGGPEPMFGDNVVYSEGNDEKFNVEKVVGEWKDGLEKMGDKSKFGCNLSIDDNRYKVACVFE
ncbi:hypothetical protein Y032_0045g1247 [Ancylostoma ceylanicum]|uniref:SCP domain-containing protein n=1 Tax=Ancylostoma ceylanicum TaxID=53326 RepID=A0A016UCP8_9BILA|nr:hypothetical protein Y032_0045g1247 [Ancylostoma ceylanicum]